LVVNSEGQSIADLKIHLFTLNPHWPDIFFNHHLLSQVTQPLPSASRQIGNIEEEAFFQK